MSLQIDLDSACVVCLQESNNWNSIFDSDEDHISIKEKIIKINKIIIPSYEESRSQYPEKICSSCTNDLFAAYRFHSNCEQTSNLLLSLTVFDEENDDGFQKNDNVEEVKIDNEATNLQLNETIEALQLPKIEHNDSEHEFAIEETTQGSNGSADIKLDASKNSPSNSNALKRFKSKLSKTNSGDIKRLKSGKSSPPKNAIKICELCGNTYKYQHALKAHMRRHLNVRPFGCECCEKKFVSNVELRRHMRVHTGQKPYSCSFCERCFSDYGSRIKHERTHTGERPFVCETCNKSFTYAHVLSVHLRTHTGEKKFQCNECGRGFTKKAYLATHVQQHNHSTSESQKPAGQEEDKLKVKSNVKHLKCSKCALVFFKKSSLVLHETHCNRNASIESETNSGNYLEDCITSYIIEENFENTEQLNTLDVVLNTK